jgi:hypothetical protein
MSLFLFLESEYLSPYGVGLDGRGPILGMVKRFFFTPQFPDWYWGPLALLQIFYGVKSPEREVDSPSSSAEVKNGGAIPPFPCMSLHSD